jgi:hypothetical protein
LEAVELSFDPETDVYMSADLDLKSTKIERFKITVESSARIWGLLESMKECAIKELELDYGFKVHENYSKVTKELLQSQEGNLKKLVIKSDVDLPNNMRLEYLDYKSYDTVDSLEFLKHHLDLKYLRLELARHPAKASTILELKNLEILELRSTWNTPGWEDLEGLYKLEKLKRLVVWNSWGLLGVSRNIRSNMEFGVYNNLEDLEACFKSVSVESIREMNRITPNLKKLAIWADHSDIVDALLATLENLEYVSIRYCNCIPSEKVYPNIKCLQIGLCSTWTLVLKVFPNLEFLQIDYCSFEVTKSSFIDLLSEFKQLKTLNIAIDVETTFGQESTLQCFREYGSHLEEFEVRVRNCAGNKGFTIEKKPNEPIRCSKKTFRCFMDEGEDSDSDL